MAAVAGDMTAGDLDINLDVNVGEDVSSADSYKVIIVNQSTGLRKEFVGTNPSANVVRYTTVAATDVPDPGTWDVQAEVTFPSALPKRTQPIATMEVGVAL